MKTYLRRLLPLLIILSAMMISDDLMATHNRAGEITYEQIGPLTIRATITTYTRASSVSVDRDSLDLVWGDGTRTTVKRSNGQGEILPNDIKVNYYVAEHTYPTRSTYKLSVTDPNRIAGILNIDFPNSVNIQFYIETTLSLLDSRFQGTNSSARLLQPPIDFACVGQVFTHNPNAYDPDGDSLAYELVTPLQAEDTEVPNYNLPNEISPGPENSISLDPVTGQFVWDSPPVQGEFNITILIKEYREGILINQIIRDMQILVRACPDENTPPMIEAPDEICVVAGEVIDLGVLATDADSAQTLELTALGGPFEREGSDAIFDVIALEDSSRATGRFVWRTTCDDISPEAYQVVFKAADDVFGIGSGLATLHTLRIKVVGPPPLDVMAEKISSTSVKITWESPYVCDDSELFQGFSVWRKNSSQPVTIDTCRGGLEGQGYEEIIFLTNEIEDGRYFAIDQTANGNAEIYCYRVLAEFASLTDSDNLYNRSESLPSEESCVRFDRKKPLITHVSVLRTDRSNGEIELQWVPPVPDEIDTISGSTYSYIIERADGINGSNFSTITGGNISRSSFSDLAAVTSLTDAGLNTLNQGHNYRISFAIDRQTIATSTTASSLYLGAIGRDHSISLSWSADVPWSNYSFDIYETQDDEIIELVSTTAEGDFTINDLENGQEYCYRVESEGTYNLDGITDPLINWSQEVCAIPTDSIPPCPPAIAVSTLCEEDRVDPDQALINMISWQWDDAICSEAEDLDGYNIYYTSEMGGDYELISSVSASDVAYDHLLSDNIAGCYYVTALDISGNESNPSIEICVDNCPAYELPNTFTPNNDGSNDVFTPTINRFVASIDMTVYNQWGQVVYTTTDPAINWNGENNGGSKLSDGTYYYVCHVFERRVSGVIQQEEPLTGYIHILTGTP